MKGIIEFRDALISADQVIMANQDGTRLTTVPLLISATHGAGH